MPVFLAFFTIAERRKPFLVPEPYEKRGMTLVYIYISVAEDMNSGLELRSSPLIGPRTSHLE